MWSKFLLVATLGVAVLGCTRNNEQPVLEKPTAGAGQTTSLNKATIVRDTYGIPHIFADNKFGLFYGYGYALGQDRLFQLEMGKRGAEGKSAEVLGVEYLAGDQQVRLGLDPAAVLGQIDALEDDLREPFEAYAAGINAWITVVANNPEKYLPVEFSHFGFQPSQWTAYDVFMLFIGNVAQIFCDSNEELNNLEFLQRLIDRHGSEKGWAIFNATMPLYDPQSPVTVPDGDARTDLKDGVSGPPPYLDKLADATSVPVRLVYNDDGKLLDINDPAAREYYLARNLALSGPAGNSGFRTASNIWLANRSRVKNAGAVLVSGPQMGWGIPSYIHAVGLHGAGYDVVGKAAFGFPFFVSAYTGRFAWGTTYGASDQTDIFELRLNPENPEQYFYKGRFLPFERRTETIAVKNSNPVEFTAYRSVHGVVISRDIDKGVAYSKKRSWEGHEVMTAAAWVDLPKAEDFASFRKQLSPMSTTVNFYYMDSAGNIGYNHSGKYPQRHPGHDNRLPVPGDGTMDWQGMQPFASNPYTYNPEQNYISNWNNRPARNWPSSDSWAGNWARANRVSAINKRIERTDSFTPRQLWEINAEISYTDLNVGHLYPYLQQALASQEQTDQVREMAQALENWDRRWVDEDKDGYYDSAAPAILDAWLRDLLLRVLQDDVGDKFFYRFASPGYPTERLRGSWDSGVGVKIIVRNLEALKTGGKHYDFFNGRPANTVIMESFQAAQLELAETYGQDLSGWRIKVPPLRFSPYNYNGIPQALLDSSIGLSQMMNRGSENNFYVISDGKIVGRDAYAPGQSGFIAPDGSKDAHYADQLDLFEAFDTKTLPLTRKMVEAMAEQAIEISYQ